MKIAYLLEYLFTWRTMTYFLCFRLWIVERQCGDTLYQDVKIIFLKPGYVLSVFTVALRDHDWNGNYIKEKRKYCKQVQQVFHTLRTEAGKLVKNNFVLVRKGKQRKGVNELQKLYSLQKGLDAGDLCGRVCNCLNTKCTVSPDSMDELSISMFYRWSMDARWPIQRWARQEEEEDGNRVLGFYLNILTALRKLQIGYWKTCALNNEHVDCPDLSRQLALTYYCEKVDRMCHMI